jgi:arsenate reductase
VSSKPVVLVTCIGNSCRSQIAAGWLRHLGGDRIEVLSAGTRPGKAVATRAALVMDEVGIDIRGNVPVHHLVHASRQVDHAIAVCEESDEGCLESFRGATFHKLPVFDPGHVGGTEDEIIQAHRVARDELRASMDSFLKEILP